MKKRFFAGTVAAVLLAALLATPASAVKSHTYILSGVGPSDVGQASGTSAVKDVSDCEKIGLHFDCVGSGCPGDAVFLIEGRLDPGASMAPLATIGSGTTTGSIGSQIWYPGLIDEIDVKLVSASTANAVYNVILDARLPGNQVKF